MGLGVSINELKKKSNPVLIKIFVFCLVQPEMMIIYRQGNIICWRRENGAHNHLAGTEPRYPMNLLDSHTVQIRVGEYSLAQFKIGVTCSEQC